MTLICCCSITEATSSTTGCPPCVLLPWLNFPLGSCSNILLHQNITALSPSCSEPALACRFCINTDPFLQEGCGMPWEGFWHTWFGSSLPSPPSQLVVGGKKSSEPLLLFLPSTEAQLLSYSWGALERAPNPIPYPFTPCLPRATPPTRVMFPQIKEPLLGGRDPLSQPFQVSAAAD